MNIRKPLFWHQGLFLQPQHFQYADAVSAAAVHALQSQLSPHHWGLAELDIAESRLASGVIELTRVAALFADGTLAAAPANAVLAARDFRAAWSDTSRPLTVYLGLKRLGPDANATVVPTLEAAAEAGTRFASLAEGEPAADLYQGGAANASLKTLTYVLRIFFDTELEGAESYELLPVARLLRDGEETLLDPHYAAPSLSLGAAPALLRAIKELRDELIGRAHQLEEYKASGDAGIGEFSPKLMRYRMALQVLARYAPLLLHYAAAPTLHPSQAYASLTQLVGELSVFSAQVDVLGNAPGAETGLPHYDHHQAGACFRAARQLVERLLNEITLGPETLVRLERIGEGRYSAELTPSFLDRRSALYLVLRTETPFDSLLDSFRNYAKLGAAEQVETYARRALPGMSSTYLRVRPEALPHRPNSTFFQLDRHDPAWAAVESERALSLLWDDAPADLKAELVLVRR